MMHIHKNDVKIIVHDILEVLIAIYDLITGRTPWWVIRDIKRTIPAATKDNSIKAYLKAVRWNNSLAISSRSMLLTDDGLLVSWYDKQGKIQEKLF